MKRVVITGMGVVSPIGIGLWNYWNSLVEGATGIRKIENFPVAGIPSQIGAQVLDFKAEGNVSKENAAILNRAGQFAVAASNQAVQDSGLKTDQEDPIGWGCAWEPRWAICGKSSRP